MQIASRHQGVLATAGAQQTWHGMQARLTRYRSGRKLWSAEAVSRSDCAVPSAVCHAASLTSLFTWDGHGLHAQRSRDQITPDISGTA